MNPVYRKMAIASVANAIQLSKAAADLNHEGLKGRARETFVQQLLKPWSPSNLAFKTGTVTDYTGCQSGQSDIIIYDPSVMATVEHDSSQGAIPSDACLATIEVKSTLTKRELAKAVKIARTIRELRLSSLKDALLFPPTHGLPEPHPPLCFLFAFQSDFGGCEFQRYLQVDPDAHSQPALQGICVIGKGFWRISQRTLQGQAWSGHPASSDHDEVIDFLGVLYNSLSGVRSTRILPKLGSYIIAERPYQIFDYDGSVYTVDLPGPAAHIPPVPDSHGD